MITWLRTLAGDCRSAWHHLWCWHRRHGLRLLAVLMVLSVIGWHWRGPIDATALRFTVEELEWQKVSDSPPGAAKQMEPGPTTTLARRLSFLGDFHVFNLGLFALLIGFSVYRDSARLRRVAVASLMCGVITGLTANVLRCCTGRPRPYVGWVDELRGPTVEGTLQALPSAHAATAFGAALPVLVSYPLVGVPSTAAASLVGWSRIQLRRHHFTDVLASLLLAMAYGLPLTQWARLPVAEAEKSVMPRPHAC